MKTGKHVRFLAQVGLIAGMYTALTLCLAPLSFGLVQCRVAEALTVLAVFTPAAVPGLTVGCLIFNLTSGMALPLDFLVGSLATLLATGAMRLLRKWPLLGLLMPALFNSFLVGWELSVYIGGGFWLNALYVAIGEAAVLLILGWPLYRAICSRDLDSFFR